MIRKVQISNFKSIPDLTLDLGCVTVLIGANGSGKSNILEAIALASAAAKNKMDNEFLISRGIRVTDNRFMRSAFDSQLPSNGVRRGVSQNRDESASETTPASGTPIKVSVWGGTDVWFDYELFADENASYPKWKQHLRLRANKPLPAPNQSDARSKIKMTVEQVARLIGEFVEEEIQLPGRKQSEVGKEFKITAEEFSDIVDKIAEQLARRSTGNLSDFLIFCPENSALRTFQSEGQILPLGIRGEGLFAHLKALDSDKNRPRLKKIQEKLTLIDWFESFDVPEDLSPGERSIRIRDRYLPENTLFDQRSANEGFLFLLFYMTLLVSPDGPSFFSIDNIDTSLNPKLCIALLQQIVMLAKEYDKQVILTTHNPAILDGLDLNDDGQRLLVVDRNKAGHTRVRRVDPPKLGPGQSPTNLSEAFLRGYLGGLPKNF
jgi:predicted ATPase